MQERPPRGSGTDTTTRQVTAALVVVLLALLGAALLFGGSSARTGPAAVELPVGRESVSTPLAGSDPAGLEVPSIGVRAGAVVELGLNEDRSLEVPGDAATIGWYGRGASPGSAGPAVFASHVNYRGERGGFAALADIESGDQVLVPRADGVTAVFVVDRVDAFPKSEFPTALVYGPTPRPEIRLITCGGTFDPGVRSYEDNVVVFGHLVEAFRG